MAISLSSAAMDFTVLRGPWPGDRQAGWRRGSQERKIGAGGARLVYFIIGESCATRFFFGGIVWHGPAAMTNKKDRIHESNQTLQTPPVMKARDQAAEDATGRCDVADALKGAIALVLSV